MTLQLKRLSFRDFRSYPTFELDDIGPLTLLVGPNAVGKTNVVEGVQLMTALTSFRHPTIEQLVRHGAPAARVESLFGDGSRMLELAMTLEGHARRYTLNGKPKRPADLKGTVPAVTFTPDDLELVKGPMSVRRAALDSLGSQLSANHYLIKKDYEKVIRYKNRLLKEEAAPALVESIDETLITCGAQLACYRAALFAKLAPEVSRRYADIAGGGEKLEVRYVPSWETSENVSRETSSRLPEGAPTFTRDEAREALARALAARRGEERTRRRALVGPHADEVTFSIDGRSAALYGSQGQQRSAVLAIKLAEAAVVEEVLDQKPLLLLDDVMSELDAARRSALVEFISGDVQTFITTANLDYFDDRLLVGADVVELPR